MERDPEKRKPNASRSYGLGMELAGAVVGFTLLGYWIDRHFGSGPWGLLICVALGLVGGMYNMIRASLAASREDAKGDRQADEDPQDR
jgi:ATP synthase protein I